LNFVEGHGRGLRPFFQLGKRENKKKVKFFYFLVDENRKTYHILPVAPLKGLS